MVTDEKLSDEQGRLAALRRHEVLDTRPETSFDRITGLVQTVLAVPIAVVSLIDERRQWFKSCIGLDITETARDISFCTYTIQTREPMHIPDALLDPRFAESPLVTDAPYIRSYLGVPFATPDGYNLGSLCAIDTKPRTFDPGQIEVLKSFAALVMDEIELRRIAEVDDLTGALTRRGFFRDLERSVARCAQQHETSALVMLDIDHFKRINDSYGHPTGDTVLRYVCKALAGQLGSHDILGRLGGEEFGVLLVGADEEEARLSAERFRQTIEALEIPYDVTLHVTASFGIAMVDASYQTPKEWVAAADAALYAAKRGGRNRCCVAPDPFIAG